MSQVACLRFSWCKPYSIFAFLRTRTYATTKSPITHLPRTYCPFQTLHPISKSGKLHNVAKLFSTVKHEPKTCQGPLFDYIDKVDSKILVPDPHQVQIAEKLQELHGCLGNYNAPTLEYLEDLKNRKIERKSKIESKQRLYLKEHGPEADVPNFEETEKEVKSFEAPRGIYMFGPVGCGKTLLMDMFYESMETEKKMRVHFSSFVLTIQSEMNKWRVQQNHEKMSPIESIARNFLRKYWLICFDEIQHTDFGTTVVLERLFSYLTEHGAVIVSTSNRPPKELGALGFSQEQELSLEEGGISDFAELLVKTMDVHQITSPTDYRLKSVKGIPAYLFPLNSLNKSEFDRLFISAVGPDGTLGSGEVLVYSRKLKLPLVCEDQKVARFSFLQLCKNPPLGPADYLSICNNFSCIFVEGIPAMSIKDKNEAKRLLSFIDAAYETRTKIFFLADTKPEDLFQLIPEDTSEDHQQLEMLEDMAYELGTDLKNKGKVADLRRQGILTGDDEIFSFKRAISRIHEMQGRCYQESSHRPIVFKPFLSTNAEEVEADASRFSREVKRREEMKTVYPNPTKTPMMNLSSEWGPGSELHYQTWMSTDSNEEEASEVKERIAKQVLLDEHPDGWWEDVVKKANEKRARLEN